MDTTAEGSETGSIITHQSFGSTSSTAGADTYDNAWPDTYRTNSSPIHSGGSVTFLVNPYSRRFKPDPGNSLSSAA